MHGECRARLLAVVLVLVAERAGIATISARAAVVMRSVGATAIAAMLAWLLAPWWRLRIARSLASRCCGLAGRSTGRWAACRPDRVESVCWICWSCARVVRAVGCAFVLLAARAAAAAPAVAVCTAVLAAGRLGIERVIVPAGLVVAACGAVVGGWRWRWIRVPARCLRPSRCRGPAGRRRVGRSSFWFWCRLALRGSRRGLVAPRAPRGLLGLLVRGLRFGRGQRRDWWFGRGRVGFRRSCLRREHDILGIGVDATGSAGGSSGRRSRCGGARRGRRGLRR